MVLVREYPLEALEVCGSLKITFEVQLTYLDFCEKEDTTHITQTS